MAHSKPLMAQSSGTDHASAAVASALRTLDAEASGIAAISAALQGSLGTAFTAAVDLIRNAKGRVIVTGHGQVRPCRAQDRGDAGLHRHAGLLRARRRSQPRRSRHDHAGRRHHRAVVVRRAAGDEEPHQLLAAASRIPHDRGHLERRFHARRSRPTSCWKLPKAREACPHNLAPTTSSLMQARDRRRARHRAAGGPRLYRAGIRQFPSRRQARRDAEIRPRHHAHRRRHPGQSARRQDVGRAGGDVGQGFRLRLHRRCRRRDRRHHHRRRSAPPHAPRPDDAPRSTRS